MADFIYRLTIIPLEYLLEGIFYYLKDLPGGGVTAITALSVVVSVLAAPLYEWAEAKQTEGRDNQMEFIRWRDHIRRSFSADERLMMQQRLYRVYSYNPMMAFRGTIPLLLQIPFFIAAYNFLSGLEVLQDYSLFGMGSLDRPDGLLTIGAYKLNLLPVLMTVVNIISAALYSRGNRKEMIQPVLLALFFLVLLYMCPSGLVWYWLCNNLFSLCKNCVKKRKKTVIEKKGKTRNVRETFIVLLTLALLFGLLVPVLVIGASPIDFVDIYHYVSPWHYIYTNFVNYLGLFVLWGGILYVATRKKDGTIWYGLCMSVLVLACLGIGVFDRKLGTISIQLVYDRIPTWSDQEIIVGVTVLFAVPALVLWFSLNKPKILYGLSRVLLLGIACVSLFGMMHIREQLPQMAGTAIETEQEDKTLFELSSTASNVVVIMLDRAVGAFMPYILEEKPELAEMFSGFVWYPNTLSFGGCTRLGQPPLYGGYEYTQSMMRERPTVSYLDKGDEELLLLPTLFSAEGYRVVMCDDPLQQNYHRTPWEQLFEGLPDAVATTTYGRYADYDEFVDVNTERNFIFYSLFRTLPPPLGAIVYDNGNYLAVMPSSQIDQSFWDSYTVLKELPKLTGRNEEEKGTLLMLSNLTTHSPCILQLPDYTAAVQVDNRMYDENASFFGEFIPTDEQKKHYHVMMAAILALADWMEYLRQAEIYDNTRIIIASDHGFGLNLLNVQLAGGDDATSMNPLLMVKDFYSVGELARSDEFMTNADVPSLSLKGIVDKPVNPFTGNEINMDMKKGEMEVPFSALSKIDIYHVEKNGAFLDVSDRNVYTVQGGIFDPVSWKLLREAE